jgi:hypothetical protein
VGPPGLPGEDVGLVTVPTGAVPAGTGADVASGDELAAEESFETSDVEAEMIAEDSDSATEVGLFFVIDSRGGVMLKDVSVVVCMCI